MLSPPIYCTVILHFIVCNLYGQKKYTLYSKTGINDKSNCLIVFNPEIIIKENQANKFEKRNQTPIPPKQPKPNKNLFHGQFGWYCCAHVSCIYSFVLLFCLPTASMSPKGDVLSQRESVLHWVVSFTSPFPCEYGAGEGVNLAHWSTWLYVYIFSNIPYSFLFLHCSTIPHCIFTYYTCWVLLTFDTWSFLHCYSLKKNEIYRASKVTFL